MAILAHLCGHGNDTAANLSAMKHVIALALLLAGGLMVLVVVRESGQDAYDRKIDRMVEDFEAGR